MNEALLSPTLHQEGWMGLDFIYFIHFLVDSREEGLKIEKETYDYSGCAERLQALKNIALAVLPRRDALGKR